MIPSSLGYEVPSKTLLSYSELWKSSLGAAAAAAEEEVEAAVGAPVYGAAAVQNQLWRVLQGRAGPGTVGAARGQGHQAAGHQPRRWGFRPAARSTTSTTWTPPRTRRLSSLAATSSPSGLLNTQTPAALAAHPQLFLLENAKLAGLTAERICPSSPLRS